MLRKIAASVLVLSLLACGDITPNNPYPASEAEQNIYYNAFTLQPRYLDPAKSYTSDQAAFIMQIYEPPLQYHYLIWPYELTPLTTTEMPEVKYFAENGKELSSTAREARVAYSEYIIKIKPGIMYQPHPAFAKDAEGQYLYHHLTELDMLGIEDLGDFKTSGTRELTVDDYIYQIKRLASPTVNSPIYGLMRNYIIGLRDLNAELVAAYEQQTQEQQALKYINMDDFKLEGVEKIDDYTFKIKLHGKYPQFKFWLAMPFFSPMPHEALAFYAQMSLIKRNITLDWFPVGTGPYMMTENNPNSRMVMSKNPNFRGEPYPAKGMPGDEENGMLADAGQTMPFIDKVVFTLEKENIPRWSKFLQGYYDSSGIESDNFDQAIQAGGGQATLTPELEAQGISLLKEVQLTDFYWGFNMLDELVGGYSVKQQKLRQAISIAFDTEEFIAIFQNDRGLAAQGPLPPGIFGHVDGPGGINHYVYNSVNGRPARKPIEDAKRLMWEAGYPDGIDPKTGRRLIINMDVSTRGDPDEKARLAWMRKQFAKIGINLNIRATDWNRFRAKQEQGLIQMYFLGWIADYPDPENFLFLFHSGNSKVFDGGVNSSNYSNPRFDRLFDRMKNMEDSPQREKIIRELVAILQQDAPWVWGFHPESYLLKQQWVHNLNINQMVRGSMKYLRVDPQLRAQKRNVWNQAIFWPIVALIAAFLLLILPLAISYWRKEQQAAQKRFKDK
jgi:ABC-type transport system substrate-binding protein